MHTDVGLGHVAFVLNLTPDDNAFRGGDLEFAEGHTMGHAVSPKFNSLAAFRVGSGAHPLPHRVTLCGNQPVSRCHGDNIASMAWGARNLIPTGVTAVDAPRGSLPRLAITGWCTIPGADPRAVSPEILNEEKGR